MGLRYTVFNHKRYTLHGSYVSKREANAMAKRFRDDSRFGAARVTLEDGQYHVWYRKVK